MHISVNDFNNKSFEPACLTQHYTCNCDSEMYAKSSPEDKSKNWL